MEQRNRIHCTVELVQYGPSPYRKPHLRTLVQSHLKKRKPLHHQPGPSAWAQRHQKGEIKQHHKNIKLVPFGALVWYKPQVGHDKKYRVKFDPKGRTGIFLGWELQPGAKWSDKYYVADLEDFTGYGTQDEQLNRVTIQKVANILFDDEKEAVFSTC